MLSSLILNFFDWDYKNDNSSDKRRYKSEVQTKWIENFKQLHVQFTGVQGCLELWAVKGGKFKLLTLWSWLFFWLFRKDFKINHIRQECGVLLKHFVATVRRHTKISLVEQKSFVHKNIFFFISDIIYSEGIFSKHLPWDVHSPMVLFPQNTLFVLHI